MNHIQRQGQSTEKTILIIGAGVAGLCTGIYGQMNGYRIDLTGVLFILQVGS